MAQVARWTSASARMGWLTPAVILAALTGCGGGGGQAQSLGAREARAAAQRYFAAQARADGRAYCAMLTARGRAIEDRVARRLTPHATCRDVGSARPPGIDPADVAYINRIRLAVASRMRIDSVAVHGGHATVWWSAPDVDRKTFVPVRGPRLRGELRLANEQGRWRVDATPR